MSIICPELSIIVSRSLYSEGLEMAENQCQCQNQSLSGRKKGSRGVRYSLGNQHSF